MQTAGPGSPYLKSQPPLCSICYLQRSEPPAQSCQGDLGSSNQNISEETKPNLSPPPTLQLFGVNLGHGSGTHKLLEENHLQRMQLCCR